MRKRIFEIIEVANDNDKLSNLYDWLMMIVIIASIVPLAFHTTNFAFEIIDKVTVSIFICDYLVRLLTADFKINKKVFSFFIYPFTPMAIIDLLSILPSISFISSTFKLLKIFRLLRTFKVFRAFKIIRYSKSINLIITVFKNQKRVLSTVGIFAIGYILFSALVIFNVEPESFNTFFDAVYWATVSLTTMGYGDIYPITTIGRMVTMVSSIFGIAIIALPSGILTAGFIEELRKNDKEKDSDQ